MVCLSWGSMRLLTAYGDHWAYQKVLIISYKMKTHFFTKKQSKKASCQQTDFPKTNTT
jgi:hypothetical protein